MARFDVHRPSAINPDDYEFVACEHVEIGSLGDCHFIMEERKRLREHMARTGGTYSHHEHGGNCGVCGNVLAHYTSQFYHKKTNSYVRVGSECSEKLGYGGMNEFKRKVRSVLEATAGKRKAKATLEAAGYGAAWALYEADGKKRDAFAAECDAWREANPEPKYISTNNGYGMEEVGAPKFKDWSKDEYVVLDMVARLIKYGSISEKAMNYLGNLLGRIAKAPAIAAARAAEDAAALPVPVSDKRITVKGTVLTVKPPAEDAPFPSYKMLVKHADGWKIWSTVPSSVLDDIERGDEIEFVAGIKVSDKDPKFAFASRPSKAKLIKAEKKEDA